ncbi:CheY-like chemotaxis protein [Filimonas zeae]|uniref:Response regulatory domain-containing protein n=1 Tax=Filimonas zeae TaxID=1737353 RepID=A0A917J3M6_9BACT|nr:response regulator [Filimonas zeae]MDR6340924.1 CheY-like chemotaxis protein [Filimonas zeae]GGH77926.1 hypothetical protein GCM10011379_45010 [Filimonas zeae]
MKKVNVIILDDDADDRMLLQEALDPGHFNIVASCSSGLDLLSFLAENPCPDMIIADFYLPGMNSLDVLRRIRLRCAEPSFLYVVLSGANVEQDPLIHENLHLFDAVMEKPDEYKKLISLNADLISIARSRGKIQDEASGEMQGMAATG